MPLPEGATPLPEAARLLNLSTEAVRKRIGRGSLEGVKESGQWFVILKGIPSGQHFSAQSKSDKTTGRTKSRPDEMAGQDVSALLTHLQGEVDFLRAELKRKDEMLWLKDQTIADLTQRLPRLPAPQEKDPSRPWYRRLFERA